MRNVWSVSYTHLDVYKRQTLHIPMVHLVICLLVIGYSYSVFKVLNQDEASKLSLNDGDEIPHEG